MNNSDLRKVYIVEQLNYEKDLVAKLFEEAGIDYMFLKGAVIRDLYPEPWMRISADVDVLVREEDYKGAEKTLRDNGHSLDRRDLHSTSFRSSVGTQLDLHVSPIPEGRKGYEISRRVWDDAKLGSGTLHEFRMTPDMLYFIHIAHIAKHFMMGGGNEYSIKDVIYINKAYGKGLARELLSEAGLLEFAEIIEEIASHKKNDDTISDDAKRVREIILDGNLLGTHRNSEMGWTIITGGGINYYRERLFPPVWNMKAFYPVLMAGHGFGILLLPLCYIHRIFKALFTGIWKNKAAEVKEKSGISKDDIEERKELLKKYNLI